ncbi:MAG: NAD(P)/FAD-dependent oxidoreductase, partial [Cyclonatronaceae bacterium]
KRSVMVLDKGFWPAGATSRNAGFACFGSAGELLDDMQQGEAETDVRQRLEMRIAGLRLLRRELGEAAIGYQACGGYELFDDASDPHYRQSVAELPRFNAWVKAATGRAQSYETCTINGFPAIRNRLEGSIHSGKMLQELARKARQAGVELRWNTIVKMMKKHAVVLENGHELQAGQVLSATNGFTRALLPDSQVQSARGMAFVTEPLRQLPWRGTFHYNRGYVYFRDVADNAHPQRRRLLIGGARDVDKAGENSMEFGINTAIQRWLTDFTSTKLQIDANWKIATQWSGIMGFGPTKTPECRQWPNGVYSAAGLGGMGIALGIQLAEEAISLLAASS